MFFSYDTQMYILYINDIHFSSFRNRYVFNFKYYIIFKYFIFARNNVCFSQNAPRPTAPATVNYFRILIRKSVVPIQRQLFKQFVLFLFHYLLNILRLIVFPFRPPDKNLNRQDTIKFYVECHSGGSHRYSYILDDLIRVYDCIITYFQIYFVCY